MDAVPSEQQQALYRLAFIQNCFTLVVRSHHNLARVPLRTAEEPHITGELVRTARNMLESEDAEPWMEHIEVLDDPPQNVSARYGKKRPRIDIEFVRTMYGRRPRFHIEAKRLHRSDSVNEYFGADGLQMFVTGTYAPEWPSAGMIGYVQSDNCSAWQSRLAEGFSRRTSELSVCPEQPNWRTAGWTGGVLDSVQQTCHDRATSGAGRIDVFHVLLDFVA